MDTKSKKFSAPLWAKAVACLLVLAGCCVIALQLYDMAYRSAADGYTPTLAKTYENDHSTAWDTLSRQLMALRMGCLLQSEQHIKAGGTLNQQRLRNHWISFFQNYIVDYVNQFANRQLDNGYIAEGAPSGTPDETSDIWQIYEVYESGSYDAVSEQWVTLMDVSDFQVETEEGKVTVRRQGPEATGVLQMFEQFYQGRLENIGQTLMEQDLRSFRYCRRYLEENQQLKYFIRSGERVFGNVPESQLKEYEKSAISMKLADSELTVCFGGTSLALDLDSGYYSTSGVNQTILSGDYLQDQVGDILDEAGQESIDYAYLWFDEAYINSLQQKVDEDRQRTLGYGSALLAAGLASLAGLLYLLCVCGRRKGEGEIRLFWLDMLYTELNLSLLCLTVAGYAGLVMISWDAQERRLLWPATLVCGGVALALLLSLVRRLKDKSFLRNCLLWKLCLLLAAPFRKAARAIRLSLSSGPYVKKAVWFTAGYGALCTLCAIVFPLSILLIVLASIFVYRLTVSFQKIQDGVRQVKNGNLGYQIDLGESAAFRDLAADINSIADGLNAAVENELKSERMKSELITNVSHDIRTPLTSVITYIDLLQKEGLDSENAPGYCEIIGQKAQRLKNLTDDLFEVSKAASGNIAVQLEDVDLAALVRQGLGELDDKVAQSGLDFRVSLPAEGLIVRADGKLLWRVIENLLSNVFKYAMPASRVYIDVQDQEGQAAFIIKNISAYELNGVDPERLMERFQRGDTARHSEGNGLGLAIAKNLAELQRGRFTITIDGDLFKASITLPKGKGKKPQPPEPERAEQPPEPAQQPPEPQEQIG